MNLKLENIGNRCQNIKSNKKFEISILAVIVLSALAVGVRSYDPEPKVIIYLTIMDYCISLIFLTEIVVRMVAEKKFLNFFKSGWNVFDLL